MRILKLGVISLLAFILLFWGITLLFPSVTVLSRIKNMPGTSDSLRFAMETNRISYKQWLVPDSGNFDVRTADISFYENDLFNAAAQPDADTLFFSISRDGKPVMKGGIGLYQLMPDSVTTQLFFVFQTPWYQPLEKMRMMVIDKQYGGLMDTSLNKLYEQAILPQ